MTGLTLMRDLLDMLVLIARVVFRDLADEDPDDQAGKHREERSILIKYDP